MHSVQGFVQGQYRVVRYGSDLTDAEWELVRPLLPPQKPRVGRPAQDHRTIINAILWVTRTQQPWRQLPARYGKWSTASSRYYRWCRAGIWDRVVVALAQQSQAGR